MGTGHGWKSENRTEALAVPGNRWSRILPYLGPVLLIVAARTLLPASICDDAYISFRVAQNLATGNGMVFNLGEAVYVSTTPLWVILLAGFRWLTGDVVLAAAILGTLFEMLAAAALIWLAAPLRHGTAIGVIAALMLCTNPFFLLSSFSGMETSLYLFLICFSLGLLIRDRFALAGAVAALAVWARVDGVIIVGVVALWILYARRDALWRRSWAALRAFMPGLIILVAYFLFGFLVFGDPLPASVQRKTSGLAPLFSAEWLSGVSILSAQALHAILETVGFWVSRNVLLVLLGGPLLIGAVRYAIERERVILPVAAFALLYFLSFVGSGNAIMVFGTWYFAPLLPTAYLCVAKGWVWLTSVLARAVPRATPHRYVGPALTVFVVLWSVFMLIGPLKRQARNLVHSADGSAGRERYYAAIAVWASKHLPSGTSIAAIEIGALGFYLPPEVAVLDIFGILRRREDMGRDYLDMVARDRPALVVELEKFQSTEAISSAHPGMYVWEQFETLDIGVRADLHPELGPRLGELGSIYDEIELNREYRWDRAAATE